VPSSIVSRIARTQEEPDRYRMVESNALDEAVGLDARILTLNRVFGGAMAGGEGQEARR
jgi:hypothetical protein